MKLEGRVAEAEGRRHGLFDVDGRGGWPGKKALFEIPMEMTR